MTDNSYAALTVAILSTIVGIPDDFKEALDVLKPETALDVKPINSWQDHNGQDVHTVEFSVSGNNNPITADLTNETAFLLMEQMIDQGIEVPPDWPQIASTPSRITGEVSYMVIPDSFYQVYDELEGGNSPESKQGLDTQYLSDALLQRTEIGSGVSVQEEDLLSQINEQSLGTGVGAGRRIAADSDNSSGLGYEATDKITQALAGYDFNIANFADGGQDGRYAHLPGGQDGGTVHVAWDGKLPSIDVAGLEIAGDQVLNSTIAGGFQKVTETPGVPRCGCSAPVDVGTELNAPAREGPATQMAGTLPSMNNMS